MFLPKSSVCPVSLPTVTAFMQIFPPYSFSHHSLPDLPCLGILSSAPSPQNFLHFSSVPATALLISLSIVYISFQNIKTFTLTTNSRFAFAPKAVHTLSS
jgi:hypothetical protein